MDMRLRYLLGLAGLTIVGMVLAVAIEAAGRGVAVAVAVAAISVLVASYVWIGLLTVRAIGDEEAIERARHGSRTHIPIMFGAPLVVLAAHPWGLASFAVAIGALVVCQLLFLHAMIVAGLIRQRRTRRPAPH
jgi:hypothetical protein